MKILHKPDVYLDGENVVVMNGVFEDCPSAIPDPETFIGEMLLVWVLEDEQ